MITVGATIPATFGQTKCNVLIDTEAMKSSNILPTAHVTFNEAYTYLPSKVCHWQ